MHAVLTNGNNRKYTVSSFLEVFHLRCRKHVICKLLGFEFVCMLKKINEES